MKLTFSPASPFARKVMMVEDGEIHVLGDERAEAEPSTAR